MTDARLGSSAGVMSEPSFLTRADGRRIATRIRPHAGHPATILFLPGYASDMMGTKALALDTLAERTGCAMARFDYSGTGASPGRFEDGTLHSWLDDALAVLDATAAGPVILVGSSMGGWIATLVALRRPERIKAFVGIAAAPDFTDWAYSDEQKVTVQRDGLVEEANPYGPEPTRTYRPFWESGQALRLLHAPIAFDGPVRLVHGDADTDVPVAIAFRLAEQLRSSDVQLTVIKGGGHRLSEPHELRAIIGCVERLLEDFA